MRIPMLVGFLLRLSGIRGPEISCERLAEGLGVMYNGIAVGPMLAASRPRCLFILFFLMPVVPLLRLIMLYVRCFTFDVL